MSDCQSEEQGFESPWKRLESPPSNSGLCTRLKNETARFDSSGGYLWLVDFMGISFSCLNHFEHTLLKNVKKRLRLFLGMWICRIRIIAWHSLKTKKKKFFNFYLVEQNIIWETFRIYSLTVKAAAF